MDRRLHVLQEYLDRLEAEGVLTESGVDEDLLHKIVGGVSFNSKEVKRNSIFVCKGAHFSEKYLEEALQSGALAYLAEKKYDIDAPYILVSDVRKAMAYMGDLFYNHVQDKLYLVGITGTKGKSTTAYFVRYILDDFLKGMKKPASAIISSIDTYDGVISEESHLTTPESLDVFRHFNNAARSEIEYLTMEVSSQALKYDRVLGIEYNVGCFLNIGEDHISEAEHPDFEDYFESKLKLFSQCDTACVNLDSKYADRILEEAALSSKRVITFGTKEDADIYGYDISVNKKDITFCAKCDSFDRDFKISMHGIFNVENALAAIAIAYALDIPLEYIYSGLKKAQAAGRMETFINGKKTVIVDYAHNKMSFESLFDSTKKEFPGKKISIVFGCPGKKAFNRRKELGEIAGKYADKVYLTEEDAGEEPLMKICEEIAAYVKKGSAVCEIIPDRSRAIMTAIREADENTIVLVTGKGRETRQKRGTDYIATPSDVQLVKKYLLL